MSVTYDADLEPRPLPSAEITRLRRYYGPLRHPRRPGLSLTSCPLILIRITTGASRVSSCLLCVHAIAITPAGPTELVRSSLSIVNGLPCETVRSAPAIIVSGPARRLLPLWPARSPSPLTTLSIESSDSFVASAAVSIATGWSEPVPGRELHPLKSDAFHGALLRQLTREPPAGRVGKTRADRMECSGVGTTRSENRASAWNRMVLK